jgi:hypothetical protein
VVKLLAMQEVAGLWVKMMVCTTFTFVSKYFLLENNIKLCFFNGFLMILMD